MRMKNCQLQTSQNLPWRLFVRSLAILAVVFGATALATADDDREPYAIGLWGDLPYSAAQAAAVPNLIADMNAQKLAFTAPDGDLKTGGSAVHEAGAQPGMCYL